MGHSVARVQKVQKVQRVQRVAVAADAFGHTFGVRVLKMDRPAAGGFASLTALRTEGGGLPLCGNAYKVSVTDLPFCVIWHDRHSAYWLAALTSPYPASLDCPRKRGQNKTPRNILFISISTVSTGCCAPSKRWQGNWIRKEP